MILPGILLGVILGVLLGYFVSDFMLAISIIGELYFNALLIITLPLILAAVISGVTALGDYRKLGRVGGKTLWYFLLTGLGAVVLAVAASLINFKAGGLSNNHLLSEMAGAASPYLIYSRLMQGSELSLFGGLLNNIQYFALVLLAVVLGGALSTFGPRKIKSVITFFKELDEALLKMFEFLLTLAPLGLLSLVGTSVALARNDMGALFASLGGYLLVLTVTFLVYGLVVLPIIYKVFTGRSPFQFLNGMLPAVLTAFATGSSTASMAVTYHAVVERNKVDHRAGSLVLSLGTVFNVSATAMWLIISVMTLTRLAVGVELTVFQVISVAVLSLLVSIGLVGVPRITLGATMIIMSLSGMPEVILAGTAVLLVADWLTDRMRAVVNVWGDAVGAAVVSETFEFKTVGRKAAAVSEREPRTRAPRQGRKTSRTDTRKPGGRERTRPGRSGPVQNRDKDSRPSRPVEREEKRGTPPGGGRTFEPKRNAPAPAVKSRPSPFAFTDSSQPDLEPDFEMPDQPKNVPEKPPSPRGNRVEQPPVRSSSRAHTDKSRSPRPAAKVKEPEEKKPEEKKPERKPKEDILDNEMFKRELARVSAHLHAIEKDKKEEETSPVKAESAAVEDTIVEKREKEIPEAS